MRSPAIPNVGEKMACVHPYQLVLFYRDLQEREQWEALAQHSHS